VIAIFVSVLQVVAIGYAFARSTRERYIVGSVGAALRAILFVVAGVSGFLVRLLRFPGLPIPTPFVLSVVAIVAALLGPLVSFLCLWLAHRRSENVSSADEERLGRPFRAWMPVAILEVVAIVVHLGSWFLARG
jgi:hypothetical protein